jgi:hypothetical protein
MAEYLVEVCRMEKFFDGFEARYVPRLNNRDVDYLAWIASSRAPTPPYVIIEKLTKPSIRPAKEAVDAAKPDLVVIDEPDQELAYDWMSPIKMFLDNQPSSDDYTKVKRIARKSKMYHLIDGILYRRGANDMMIKCISREEGIQLLYVNHTCHGALSQAKPSGTVSTGLLLRMTRWRSSPNVRTVSSFRSK